MAPEPTSPALVEAAVNGSDDDWQRKTDKQLKYIAKRHNKLAREIAVAIFCIFFVIFLGSFFIIAPYASNRTQEITALREQMLDVQKYLVQELVNPCLPDDTRCRFERLETLKGFKMWMTSISGDDTPLHDIPGLTD